MGKKTRKQSTLFYEKHEDSNGAAEKGTMTKSCLSWLLNQDPRFMCSFPFEKQANLLRNP